MNPLSELYLIAHKVRGEAAFDVAQKLQIGDEEGWIIPTSGHRAYPYWYQSLEAVFSYHFVPPLPPDLRDHYEQSAEQPKRKLSLEDLDL